MHYNSKSYGSILTKFYGKIEGGPRKKKLTFSVDPGNVWGTVARSKSIKCHISKTYRRISMKFCGLVDFGSLFIPTCWKGDPGDVWGTVVPILCQL